MSEDGRYIRLTESENATESEREPMLNDHAETSAAETSAPTPPSPPPSYSPSANNNETTSGESSVTGNEMPPAYDIAAKLPTYEEAEMSKHSDPGLLPNELRNPDGCNVQLGTDSLFALCFLGFRILVSIVLLNKYFLKQKKEKCACFGKASVNVGKIALIFNWIGFIFAYCVTDTIAGRYGALSGFGLSLIKWVFILKHSKCCKDLAFEDAWLWWLFALLGWLVFIRGILVYAQVKKSVRAGQAIYIPRYWGLTRTE